MELYTNTEWTKCYGEKSFGPKMVTTRLSTARGPQWKRRMPNSWLR
jgi:hypothetical protein